MAEHWSDEIIREYSRFYRLAFAYVKNEQDAQDIVQEAFLKALRSAPQLKNPEYVLTWFYRIVCNTSHTFLRKRHNTVPFPEGDPESMPDFAYSEGSKAESAIALQQALDQLPTKYKDVVMLRFVGDQKISDVAKILHINENTAKTRLYAALRKLRIDLDGCGMEEFE